MRLVSKYISHLISVSHSLLLNGELCGFDISSVSTEQVGLESMT